MRPDDRIDEWAKARTTADVPPGFADDVIAAALAERRGRAVRGVVLALAALAGAARVAAAVALFIPR